MPCRPCQAFNALPATFTTLLILFQFGCASGASSSFPPFTAPAQLAGFNIDHDFDRISDDIRVRIEQHLGASVFRRVDATYLDGAGHHIFFYVAKTNGLTDAGIRAAMDDALPDHTRDAVISQDGAQFLCRADPVANAATALTLCTWRSADVFGLVTDGRTPTDSQRTAAFADAVQSVIVTQ